MKWKKMICWNWEEKQSSSWTCANTNSLDQIAVEEDQNIEVDKIEIMKTDEVWKINEIGDTFLNYPGINDMRVFEESYSKSIKNEYIIKEVDDKNINQWIQNGHIFIYSFQDEETKAYDLLKLVQDKHIEQRTTIWINLIEMESEFHQQDIVLNKRMAISMTNELSQEKYGFISFKINNVYIAHILHYETKLLKS